MRHPSALSGLLALLLGCAAVAQDSAQADLGRAAFLGEVDLSAPVDRRFGGLSAVEVSPDGTTAVVLSDRATLFTVTLERDAGALAGATLCCGTALRWEDGFDLPVHRRDSEGLARLSDGTLAISFEGGANGRVAVHTPGGIQIAEMPPIPSAAELPVNGGFEGLAIDAAGRLYTLAEEVPDTGPLQLLRLENGAWQVAATLQAHSGWSPVALDFDDQSRLYLLQRRAVLPVGFATRLTRFDLSGEGGAGGERLLQTPITRHGNLEGLSLWRDASGRLIATMVSDNDFMAFRSTSLVEYALPD